MRRSRAMSSASGGDTPQYALQFLAGGDHHGDLGFNAAGAYNRLVTFNAVADGNGRNAYTNSVRPASRALRSTRPSRCGRALPRSSGSEQRRGHHALLADTGSPEVINFVFTASLPTAAQHPRPATRAGATCTSSRSPRTIVIAAKSGTNAPAGLSAAELLKIYTGVYTTWNQLPGNSGGSSTRSSRCCRRQLVDLQDLARGPDHRQRRHGPTLATDIKTVEQNDPTVLTAPPVLPTPSCRSLRPA